MKPAIILILITTLVSCSNQKSQLQEKKADPIQQINLDQDFDSLDCSRYKYVSISDQADSLLKYYKLSITSESHEKLNLDKKFFCAFPNSFTNMQELFGFNDDTGAGPLYEYPLGENIIKHFSNLTSIPKFQYYDKYINICVNGFWQADNIRAAFGFGDKLVNDCKAACSMLKRHRDNEIKSVFRFIFDGPHPINEVNKQIYKGLVNKIEEQDKKLSELFTEAYNEVMSSYDGHGK